MNLTGELVSYICNPALISIGARLLTGATDTSNEADLCRAMYEQVRDAELRERIWNCTKKRDALTVDETEPNHDWDYRYALPDDCLYVIELEDDADFTVESGYILTNECNSDSEINILYVQKAAVAGEGSEEAVNAEVARFDSTLRNVLAKRLGAELAKALTKHRTEQEQAWGLYDRALDGAALANAFEDRHDRENRTETESEWITSRQG